jgi:hypothetical protein
MLAARLAEALVDIILIGERGRAPREIVRYACRVMLPTVMASGLLVIALPPLIDLRWWGAVLPAQILLLGALPCSVIFVRGACRRSDEPYWRAVQAIGGVAIVELVAAHGLLAIAAAMLGWMTAVALASLWPIRKEFAANCRAALAEAVRPCAGAMAASFLLFWLAGPMGLALDPVPALCLLIAAGWLAYVVVRGEPRAVERLMAPIARQTTLRPIA